MANILRAELTALVDNKQKDLLQAIGLEYIKLTGETGKWLMINGQRP